MIVRLISQNEALKGFNYFWGKHVVGFNPNVHCARCLRGEYSPDINLNIKVNTDINIPLEQGEVFYICGVAKPYNWSRNGHLALKVKDGAKAQLKLWQGDIVEVDGAQQIQFDDKPTIANFSNLSKAYTTCRNFQFGVYYFGKEGKK